MPFEIVGIVNAANLLPDPAQVPDNKAYLVGTAAPYDLYVQATPESGSAKEWVNAGPVIGVQGPQGEQGEKGYDAFESNDYFEGIPAINSTFTLNNYNRPPIQTDKFLTLAKNRAGTRGWLISCSVTHQLKGQIKNFTEVTGPQGPQGEDGQGYNWMGNWVSENEYHPYDCVFSNGSAYICIAAVNASTTRPENDATHWQIMALGAPKLYLHVLTIFRTQSPIIYVQFFSRSSTPITTVKGIVDALPAGYKSGNLICNGVHMKDGTACPIHEIKSLNGSTSRFTYIYTDQTGEIRTFNHEAINDVITDVVVEL